MIDQSAVRKRLGVLVVTLPLYAGCGGDTLSTGPAEAPNSGPGGPAGAGKAESQSPFATKGFTPGATKPEAAPADAPKK